MFAKLFEIKEDFSFISSSHFKGKDEHFLLFPKNKKKYFSSDKKRKFVQVFFRKWIGIKWVKTKLNRILRGLKHQEKFKSNSGREEAIKKKKSKI